MDTDNATESERTKDAADFNHGHQRTVGNDNSLTGLAKCFNALNHVNLRLTNIGSGIGLNSNNFGAITSAPGLASSPVNSTRGFCNWH